MAVYTYSGIDRTKRSVQGTVHADSPRQARDRLRDQGIFVRKITSTGQRTTRLSLPQLNLMKSKRHWADSVGELAMLLRAGITLLDAMDTIAREHRGAYLQAWLQVREKVAAGESFAQALVSRPDWFDDASIQMVEVGENAGTLEEVLEQVAEFKQRQRRLTDALTTALLYPMFLVVFGAAAAVFLMTQVLPPLLANLEETLDQLPWPTRVARTLSDALLDYRWSWGGLIVAVIVAAVAAWRHPRTRFLIDRWILKLPIIGPMVCKQNVSRIAMIIGTLSRSGVELTRAVDLAQRSTSNGVLRQALKECGARIAAGEEFADALGRHQAFPPLAVRVFSVGQESGKLDEMLFRLADDYDEQVKTASARLTALIEPVLILVLALMVGFLLLATILPILEAGNVL